MRTERARIANLAVLLVALAALAALLAGAAFWLGLLIVLAAAAFGAFHLLGDLDPRGVPVESLTTPAVAAGAVAAAAHLVGPGGELILVLGGGGLLVAAALRLEVRLIGPADEARERREQLLVPLVLLVGFIAFLGVAGAVYAGLAAPLPGTTEPAAIDQGGLLLLAVADGAVAFLLGYRLAAARAPDLIEAAWAGGTFACVIGVAAALLRALALPRLLGPAILTGVFYLWSAYRAASGSERRSRRWLWEYLVLAVTLVGAVAWNLLVR